MARTDAQWQAFVDGKRRARAYLYKRLDADAVSAEQRAADRIEYD